MRLNRGLTALAAWLVPAMVAGAQPQGTLIVTLIGEAGASSTPRMRVAITTADAMSHAFRIDSVAERSVMMLSRIPAGRYRVETRMLGFIPDTTLVEIGNAGTANIRVDLQRLPSLDTMTITNQGRLAAFAKRRTSGKGTFLTREDIEKTRRTQVSEVLRSVRGLRVECAGTCRVRMARSTNCQPRYYANGFPVDASILRTPAVDVAGIEIYRGPAETPAEFLSAQSMCGAIVIWIK
jgi:hypothetical protein